MPSALIVGLDPALLTDPHLPVNERRVRASMDAAVASLRGDGITASLFLLRGPVAAVADELRAVVLEQAPDAVMIGAGVRLEPSLSWLLELLVNAVIEAAPAAKLCFNEDPEAMATAVRRVIPVGQEVGLTGGVRSAPIAHLARERHAPAVPGSAH